MSETFVLIAGACHGGWSWRPLAEQLRSAGHRVLTPTLPGLADGDDPRRHSLADVADFVVDLVERHDLVDVTMVAHSWGGYPMTGAAHRLAPRLRKLVYWSAFVPAEGVPLLGDVPPHYAEMFTQVAAASGNNSVIFPYEVFTSAFMQDADEGLQRLVHGLLTPQPMQYFTETVASVDPLALGVPASYVLCTEDLALPPGEWAWAPRFPQRLGNVPVIETPGSHEALFTRPAELAAALVKA
ncbi:alpha/beta hydrolase [Actinoplanes sp. ATCC 53533]|uniref:alpha/beta fold hydrolase n=1 Tax=Actinoplanes sp. ATCC 53533 TaxID=1288362 RepID=UPI000F79C95F|nr:alpha/beta hydrolase family protein [Actinoplanes sp. ATCC 53533]RSM70689.1 alpha/beta hydrolase [Actinoplanes sp. ATCC 53533]